MKASGWASRVAGLAFVAVLSAFAPAFAKAPPRSAEDEIIYFVLPDRFANGDARNDRGGIAGDHLAHGFDPTSKGFYQGGDFKGLLARLDYIQSLGATAIWLAPVFKNQPVQGAPGRESAGYHGYWVLDFTRVDPHLGSEADFKRLVDAAHARGMKVYLDIIANHTADVLRYRECPANDCAYRSVADYPYTRRGGISGPEINAGFAGPSVQTADNFAALTDPTWAYTAFTPPGLERAKTPAWLNDPIYYHNRGDTNWAGESSELGDFAQLDDLFTEHPRVVQGFIEIFGDWIDRYRIDGYRIDTARHVNPEFWRAFSTAMHARANASGIEDFFIFGEVYDPDVAALARWTKTGGLPSVLDFAFQEAAAGAIARNGPTSALARLFQGDALYEGSTAMRLPTFVGNHDMGRFGYLVARGNPVASRAELFKRVRLGYGLMMMSRGAPTIYYGDEQGFVGDGNDQDARETLFASRTASYLDNTLLHEGRSHAQDLYDQDVPMFRAISEMAAVRKAKPALRRGATLVRAYGDAPGLFAFSRVLDGEAEIVVAVNTGVESIEANIVVEHKSRRFASLIGACMLDVNAPGSYKVKVPALDFVVCEARNEAR